MGLDMYLKKGETMKTTYNGLLEIGFKWGLDNAHRFNTNAHGWLSKMADVCERETQAPRCWALLVGIKAGVKLPKTNKKDMGI